MMRKSFAALVVVIGVVAVPGAAWAAITPDFFFGGNASAGFVNFTPAPPGSSETQSIKLTVNGTNGSDFDDFAGFELVGVDNSAPATPPKFDFRPTVSGPTGGAPRLVILFSDGGNGQLRPLSWTADTWVTIDGASNLWDNAGGTCGFMFGTSYAAMLACHAGATVTAVFVVTDVGWLHPGGYDNYIDNVTYEGETIIGPPPPTPNLSITKDCSPDQVAPGGLITCVITVNNPGPGTATNLTVTDDLSAGLTLVGAPSGGGFACVTQAASPEIVCTKASQPPGSASITYTARIPNTAQPGQQFPNTAKVSTNPADPVPGNNTSGHTVSVPACTKSGAGNIVGTPGNDVICGSAGPDNITAGGGNDLVFGRGGNDFITGGAGNDNILGEAGNDSITGGAGTDRADGGAGTDRCTAEVKLSCP